MTTFALRISCPDRPGALGAVATALGRAGTNIVSLDVLERTASLAIDHLVVDGRPSSLQTIIDAAESVPGVVVELVHTVPPTTEHRTPLDVAAALVDATDKILDLLVDAAPDAFQATWCVAVRARSPQPLPLASSAGAPSLIGARTPWLPIERARRLDLGPWVPDRWSLDPLTASFAVAPLAGRQDALLVARTRGPVFRAREVRDLENVARVAGALLRAGEPCDLAAR